MKVAFRLSAIAACAVSAGCASIVSDSQYPVTISSNPAGSTVVVKDKRGLELHRGTTPTTLVLSAKSGYFQSAEYSLEFEKEGYDRTTQYLSASMDGWYVGNIIFGGLIGFLIVDPATGAMWKLNSPVSATLSPSPLDPAKAEAAATTSNGKSADIAAQLKQLKDLLDSGILSPEEYESRRKQLVEHL